MHKVNRSVLKITLCLSSFLMFNFLQADESHCKVRNTNPKEIKLAVAASEPWVIIENGEVSGIDVDITREVAERMGVTITMVQCNWVDCLQQSKTGSIDLFTNLFKNSEREVFLRFIEPAYLEGVSSIFYGRGNSRYQVANYSDLSSLKIGVEREVLEFERFDKDSSLDKVFFENTQSLLQALVTGEVDVIIGQDGALDYLVKKRKDLDNQLIKQRYSAYTPDPGYFAASKCSHNDGFWKRFEHHFITLINEGFVAATIAKYK